MPTSDSLHYNVGVLEVVEMVGFHSTMYDKLINETKSNKIGSKSTVCT